MADRSAATEAVAAIPRFRILILEDDPDDAELLELELRRSGYESESVRVDTLRQFDAALAAGEWDLILADYQLSGFTALDALAALRASGRDIPFIIVSGSVGEELAVEAMRLGARDFFLKDRLTRLASAVARELREAEMRRERRDYVTMLDNLYETAPIGLAFIDREFRFARVNTVLAGINGMPVASHLGRTLREVLPAIAPTIEGYLRQVLATGRPVLNVEISDDAPLARGGRRDWLANYYPVPVGIGAIVIETTEIKRGQAERERLLLELKQAIAARDEFLSIASHELKTPLTPLELHVTAAIELIDKLRADPRPEGFDKLGTKLGKAAKQVERLIGLVGNLLEVTRITSGRLALARRELELGALVNGVASRLREVIQRSGSTLVIAADRPVWGEWDRGGLEVITGNLIMNAVKFGEGRPIEIEIEAADGVATLCVTDQGIGIAPDEVGRIFQRFERAVPARHYGGFGIGLWVVRNIVDVHGGSIRVESEKGKGSRFVVELPLGAVT